MRIKKTRLADSSFELNLAPFLDIVVSVIPLLLLSVVFVEIKMIETPVPQVVQQAMDREDKDKNPDVTLNLRVSLEKGFTIEINDHGTANSMTVPVKAGQFDFEGLHAKAAELKKRYPSVFRMGLAPEATVPFN